MSDLISREAAIRKLQDKGEEPRYQHTDEDWKCGLFMAEDIINDLPSAQTEQKVGKWILADLQIQAEIDNGNYCYNCSNCGKGDIHAKSAEVPYCWWCGARMRGEEDESERRSMGTV